jgi:hypothetical protein
MNDELLNCKSLIVKELSVLRSRESWMFSIQIQSLLDFFLHFVLQTP